MTATAALARRARRRRARLSRWRCSTADDATLHVGVSPGQAPAGAASTIDIQMGTLRQSAGGFGALCPARHALVSCSPNRSRAASCIHDRSAGWASSRRTQRGVDLVASEEGDRLPARSSRRQRALPPAGTPSAGSK
jgi:7-keto-8-aminopelargonate synthetase-like enzyme